MSQQKTSNEQRVRDAAGLTVFLGTFAGIGIIFEIEEVSKFLSNWVPTGVSFTFVDPIFAGVITVIVWVHVWYRWCPAPRAQVETDKGMERQLADQDKK
jgi:hypothetical protein